MRIKDWMVAAMAALAVVVSAQVDPTRGVATVNGETIRGEEYYRRMEFMSGMGLMDRGNFTPGAPGYLTLVRLIEERILIGLAKEKGAYPTEAEVKAEIAARTVGEPKYLEMWTAQGLTLPELQYQVRLDLSLFKLQTLGITITDQEINQHYKDNPTRFTVPKRWDLRLIAVPNDQRGPVETDLAAGKAFAEVAKARSQDPTSDDGGSIGAVPVRSFNPNVQKAIEAIKIGQVTEWIQGETASIKFYLVNVLPEEKMLLDDKLRRQLRRSLMVDRGQVKNDVEKMLREARKKAAVEIKQVQFSAQFVQLLQRYKLGLDN